MPIKAIVIGGSLNAYYDWCRSKQLKPEEYRYVDTEERWFGIDRDTPVILLYGYYRSRAYTSGLLHRFHNIRKEDS